MSNEPDNEEHALDDSVRDAWEPQLPPSDFAEKVLGRVRQEAPVVEAAAKAEKPQNIEAAKAGRQKARRWGAAAGVTGLLALAAALAVRVTGMPPAHGAAIAKDRIEVSIGDRARAVLEPGADVRWDGDDVVQAHGDVFYRVEPGARFRVHTPAGDVEVKGTCFAVKVRGEGSTETSSNAAEAGDMEKRDVKSGVIGAALSALAFVAVYEGKVAVSHASERQDLAAGEAAQLGRDGVSKSGTLGEGEKSFDAKLAAASSADEPLAKANENLVSQVGEYRARLEAIAAQKLELEAKLKKTEEKLAGADGGMGRTRPEWELDKDDWIELAKKGEVKFRRPCFSAEGWDTKPEKLNSLGLAPQDGATLKSAYERSYQRLWAQIRPMCIAALGSSGDVIDKIGADSCTHLIYDLAQKADPDAASEAQTEAAEIRAGLRPEPGPNDKIHPVLKLFLLLTGAMGSFEGDLAKSLGPDEAHRVSLADRGLCMQQSRWGGGKIRDAAAAAKSGNE
jgi:ferric-dicitrate binding protein FerR (iron transport regulator)